MDKRLLALTSKKTETILKQMGFRRSRQKGGHIQFVGYLKGIKRRVTLISGQKGFAPRTMKSMIEQTGLTEKEWLSYL